MEIILKTLLGTLKTGEITGRGRLLLVAKIVEECSVCYYIKKSRHDNERILNFSNLDDSKTVNISSVFKLKKKSSLFTGEIF